MKKVILGALASVVLAGFSSCSSDDFGQNAEGNFTDKVVLTSEPYTFEDGTRTTLTNTGSAISFAWDDDETIGIFPIAPTTNNQAKQTLNGGTGDGTTSTFDGAGWALKKGNTYAAYYPYQETNFTDYTKVPVDMTGQTQSGDASLAHIGASYDYMYAEATVPSSGTMQFDFKHVAAIVMLELTMPDAATWSNVTLAGTGSVFTTKGTMNVSTGAIASKTTSSSISLDLQNVATTSANKTVTLYMAVLPCTTGALTLTATTSASKSYTATLATKTLQAGHAYKWTATPKAVVVNYGEAPDGAVAVDLGLSVKWANMNVGATTVTGYGGYYAWGETKAYGEEDTSNAMNYSYASSYTKTYYDWSTYKYCQGSKITMTKYCNSSDYGTVDNKTTLDAEDDAATVNWGGNWRMPTYAEQQELYNNCYWVYTSSYNGSGIVGYIVYKAKSDSDKGTKVYSGSTASSDYSLSDAHIFLPCAGYRSISSLYGAGSYGNAWSSSVFESYCNHAWELSFNSGGVSSYYRYYRCYGQSVRAVCE